MAGIRSIDVDELVQSQEHLAEVCQCNRWPVGFSFGGIQRDLLVEEADGVG